MSVGPSPDHYDLSVETLIIGAGACGLIAALAAHEAGQEVLVIEADAVPSGSTALSAGLIPAAGTRLQKEAGIKDSTSQFADDIQAKAKGENDAGYVHAMAQGAGPAIDWLCGTYGLPFSLVTNFDYPGHSARRMHGLPTRSGAELINALRTTVETAGIDIICERRAVKLFHTGRMIDGVQTELPDGSTERVACRKLILACNGYGGNRQMVHKHMPQIENGLWFGHDGNKGDAVIWGQALGAATKHLGAFQGHGNVAHPHGVLITWAVITQGGVQVNLDGDRFWDESQGYSEAAQYVLSQPDGVAWAIFDDRIAATARQFQDFKDAEAQGAVKTANSIAELADVTGLPVERLSQTLARIPVNGTDTFGRRFGDAPLKPPFNAVKVTGALFHTQGGLNVTAQGRVLHADGAPFPNLFAAGGAAVGVSGAADAGYLSGNGLLSALVLGRAAGAADTTPQ
jgi:fumarate reductase flavoprotein subunit